MYEYVRCMIANYITLYGVLCTVGAIAAAILLVVFKPPMSIVLLGCVCVLAMGAVGAWLLRETSCGLYTYDTFKRTQRVIRERGIVYARARIKPHDYCAECGRDLAIDDAKKGRG